MSVCLFFFYLLGLFMKAFSHAGEVSYFTHLLSSTESYSRRRAGRGCQCSQNQRHWNGRSWAFIISFVKIEQDARRQLVAVKDQPHAFSRVCASTDDRKQWSKKYYDNGFSYHTK
ncbi:hypothetical protein BJ741DRAFT_636320 [Chytriomyces cf. hyalinus JEL632]|nr:hypothetical protein BJ741DRAFT_636320 [Chytriomyces cf. hyalinus JEL632]